MAILKIEIQNNPICEAYSTYINANNYEITASNAGNKFHVYNAIHATLSAIEQLHKIAPEVTVTSEIEGKDDEVIDEVYDNTCDDYPLILTLAFLNTFQIAMIMICEFMSDPSNFSSNVTMPVDGSLSFALTEAGIEDISNTMEKCNQIISNIVKDSSCLDKMQDINFALLDNKYSRMIFNAYLVYNAVNEEYTVVENMLLKKLQYISSLLSWSNDRGNVAAINMEEDNCEVLDYLSKIINVNEFSLLYYNLNVVYDNNICNTAVILSHRNGIYATAYMKKDIEDLLMDNKTMLLRSGDILNDTMRLKFRPKNYSKTVISLKTAEGLLSKFAS